MPKNAPISVSTQNRFRSSSFIRSSPSAPHTSSPLLILGRLPPATTSDHRRPQEGREVLMGTGKNGFWRAEGAVTGYANVIEALREIIIYPIIYSEESQKLGLKWPRGLLLYCPMGMGKVLYVPPPDLDGREEILCAHTSQMKLGEDVNLRCLAEDTDLFTGAELAGLCNEAGPCNEAGMVALREDMSAAAVYDRHFWTARNSLRPALMKSQIETYTSFMKRSVS